MLLAGLILVTGLFLGDYISRQFFKAERFASSLALGIAGFTYLFFLISLIFGPSELAALLSIAACLATGLAFHKMQKTPIFPNPHDLFSKDSLAVFIASLILIAYASSQAFDYSNGLTLVSQDWAVHIGIVNTLSSGNFPPHYPYFSSVPLSYYYFGHLFIASLVMGGFEIFFAYSLVISLLIASFISAFYALSRDFLKSKAGGLLTIFLAFFSSACAACLIGDAAWLCPFFPSSQIGGFPLRPLVLSYAFSQLPMAFSYLFFMAFLKAFLELEKGRKFLVLGILVGLLPMFGPFFFALGFIFIAYGILFERNRGFFKGALVALFLGAGQYLLMFNDKASASALRFIRLELYAHLQSVPDLLLFWFQNAGGHIILALLGILIVKQRKDLRNLLMVCGLLYVLASFIIIFPDSWANEKLFMPFFILLGLFAAGFIMHLVSQGRFLRIAGLLLISLALLSSMHQFKFFIPPSFPITQQSVGDADTFEACKWIAENIPQNSVFLAPAQLEESGCIYVYAGRLAWYSNPYWVWSQGFDVDRYENEQKQMLAGDTPLLSKYRVGYVLANREFEGKIEEPLRKLLTPVYSNEGVTVYQLDGNRLQSIN